MPESLGASLTPEEFTDLIEYLVSLKQPENATLTEHGMPDVIPALPQPVELVPVFPEEWGFLHPVWFGPIPGLTSAFAVVEHETGRIWRCTLAAPQDKEPFLDTGASAPGTRGLLGLAFHPQFAANRKYYYVKHVVERGQFSSLVMEGVAGEDLRRDSGRPARLVLKLDAATNVHYGGSLMFGPDGYLYVGMGDTGPQEDPQGHAQNTQLLLGKILRIDVDHPPSDQAYTVPPDNPFVGRAGYRPEIWAYGLREPWRFSFDRLTGDLWVGDVGQDRYEEIDLVRRGENMGWNVWEGFEPFSNRYKRDGEQYVSPVFAYRRKFGPSVTGGFVYHGGGSPSFGGVYIFGDYESRRVFGLTQKDRRLVAVRQLATAPERVVSFGQDLDGELYVVGYEGTIYRLRFGSARFE